MKKFLLPENGNFYKANLHCHTTLSDGRRTPEEIKEEYMANGYSIVAYTDHDIFIRHPELADEDFLPLNGYEMEVNQQNAKIKEYSKTCHMCFVALDPDIDTQVCYHRERYLFGNAVNQRDKLKFDESLPDYERVYSSEGISEMMKMGRDAGFFVTYNHPTWSLEDYNDYMGYENMHAFEIANGSCLVAGFDDYNVRVYDDMLRGGKRIYCIGADDNHNAAPKGSRKSDACRAYIMIKADKLEYRTIGRALLDGSFYTSRGPAIESLYFEDGKVHITCSDADRISYSAGARRARCEYAEEGGVINSASFEVRPEDKYFRLTVTDKQGYTANTNAYFTDELFAE